MALAILSQDPAESTNRGHQVPKPTEFPESLVTVSARFARVDEPHASNLATTGNLLGYLQMTGIDKYKRC